MTLSDLIVNYLEQFGVEYVFSIPGSPLGPLYDALSRSEKRGGPKIVLAYETKDRFRTYIVKRAVILPLILYIFPLQGEIL